MTSISVIIPTYNAQKTIIDTINSVVNQTFAATEIIVVDDCSTDKTVKILKDLQKQVLNLRIYQLEQNFGGPAGPRNFGLAKANGTYLSFLDSDDLWHPMLLENYLQFYECGISMLSSTKLPFKDSKQFTCQEKWIEQSNKLSKIKTQRLTYKNLLNANFIVNSSVFIKRSKFDEIRFEIDKKFIAVEDFIAWCNVHKKFGPSLQLDLKMVGYRMDVNSLSSNKFSMLKKRIHALSYLGLSKIEICYRIIIFILIKLFGVQSV